MTLSKRAIDGFLEEGSTDSRPYKESLLESITSSTFSIEYSRVVSPTKAGAGGSLFFLIVKPSREAQRRYGIDREVLVLCSTYPTFSARDTKVLHALEREFGPRLSSMFCVLVSKYQRADRSSIEVESADSRTIVHLTFDELDAYSFEEHLTKNLFSRDPFDLAGAVVRTVDFFGRREQIDLAVADIETQTSQIGIFGLRKAGKTSLLNRLSEKLQNSARVYVARLDLQWATAINSSPEYTAWAIGEAIFDSHKDIRKIKDLILFGKFKTFSSVGRSEDIWEAFANDFRRICENASRPVCLIFDEIERMYEESPAGFVRFWRVMRGLDQQYPGRIRIVIGGTSPQCSENDLVGGKDNPMFNYLKVHYLGPLSLEDCSEMMSSLGRLGGLSFTEEALKRTYEVTGGHPALARSLGSAAHAAGGRLEVVTEVDIPALQKSSNLIKQKSAPLIEQMLSSLEAQYADEHTMLEILANGGVYEFQQYAASYPLYYRRLVNYGLVAAGDPAQVKIGQLRDRMQHVDSALSSTAAEYSYTSGQNVDDWEIVAPIARGGIAEVYRVRKEGEPDRALKVFKYVNTASVAREVDVLREFKHQNIVKFEGMIASNDSRPCLLMELLDGISLADYCTEYKRPNIDTWFRWLSGLLDALSVMHPKSGSSVSSEMSPAMYAQWRRDKVGYIHRDIKPENVIVVDGRGPVLFDFNISSKAGAEVRTMSATEGYFPPPGVSWGPFADLYALGVTFAELGSGSRRGKAVEDSDLLTSLSATLGGRASSAAELLMNVGHDSDLTTREVSTKIKMIASGGVVDRRF